VVDAWKWAEVGELVEDSEVDVFATGDTNGETEGETVVDVVVELVGVIVADVGIEDGAEVVAEWFAKSPPRIIS